METSKVRRLLEKRKRELEENRSAVENEVGLDEAQTESSGELAHPTADMATDTAERERAVAISEDNALRIAEIEDALRRLDDGRYGRCEVCGEPIADERLEARPEARYCIEHQESAERPG